MLLSFFISKSNLVKIFSFIETPRSLGYRISERCIYFDALIYDLIWDHKNCVLESYSERWEKGVGIKSSRCKLWDRYHITIIAFSYLLFTSSLLLHGYHGDYCDERVPVSDFLNDGNLLIGRKSILLIINVGVKLPADGINYGFFYDPLLMMEKLINKHQLKLIYFVYIVSTVFFCDMILGYIVNSIGCMIILEFLKVYFSTDFLTWNFDIKFHFT